MNLHWMAAGRGDMVNGLDGPELSSKHLMDTRLGTLLQRAIGSLRSRHWSYYSERKRKTLLEPVITDLQALNRQTEQDFLTVGGKLMEFTTAARQISADMAALSELISGEESRHACQVLTRVLEQSRLIEARAEAGDQALAAVNEANRRIGSTFRSFRDTVSVFQVLGSLTRIETSRLGRAGSEFGHLGEEVSTLTKSIESGGQGILEASTALHRKMDAVIARISGLRARKLQELPELVAKVKTGLESLEEVRLRGRESSLRQAEGYAQVSASIEDLIPAIQFHDVTRQQIEHVADALHRLGGSSKEACGGGSTGPLNLGTVLTLQSSQLASAEQIFASSVERIERDLDTIAERVAGMAEASKTLLGSAGGERGSFFVQMEGLFTAILKILRACHQAEIETESALCEFESTVARMQKSVSEIREIEIRIGRMAINAMVRAAQIGGAGKALQVIADMMQRLAFDSNAITDQVTAALGAITGAVHGRAGESGEPPGKVQSEAEVMACEMRATVLELHSSDESSFSRLSEIAVLSSGLHNGIQACRSRFSAGSAFAGVVQRTRTVLEGIAAYAAPGRLEAVGSSAERHMEGLAKHYTMQAEREVHESVARGTAIFAFPVSEVPVVVPEGDDLGDNVELF
jgi:hypothetical protein